MHRVRPLLLLAILFVLLAAPMRDHAQTATDMPTLVMAGVPRYLGETHDYDRIFAELAAHQVSAYLPTFQYQEVPIARSLDYELDFLPPCQPDDPAFVAARKHAIDLLIPIQLLDALADALALTHDPLIALLECLPPEHLAGILSIDEPLHFNAALDDPTHTVAAIYDRVQAVAPDTPVWMVHAPLLADVTMDAQAYLEAVAALSPYADVIGFDVYPIPSHYAQLLTPYDTDTIASLDTAIPDYLNWLEQTLPHTSHMIVLQAFSYEHLYADPPASSPLPTAAELEQMLCQAIASDVDYIVWWGASFLSADDADFWEQLLAINARLVQDPQSCAVSNR